MIRHMRWLLVLIGILCFAASGEAYVCLSGSTHIVETEQLAVLGLGTYGTLVVSYDIGNDDALGYAIDSNNATIPIKGYYWFHLSDNTLYGSQDGSNWTNLGPYNFSAIDFCGVLKPVNISGTWTGSAYSYQYGTYTDFTVSMTQPVNGTSFTGSIQLTSNCTCGCTGTISGNVTGNTVAFVAGGGFGAGSRGTFSGTLSSSNAMAGTYNRTAGDCPGDNGDSGSFSMNK